MMTLTPLLQITGVLTLIFMNGCSIPRDKSRAENSTTLTGIAKSDPIVTKEVNRILDSNPVLADTCKRQGLSELPQKGVGLVLGINTANGNVQYCSLAAIPDIDRYANNCQTENSLNRCFVLSRDEHIYFDNLNALKNLFDGIHTANSGYKVSSMEEVPSTAPTLRLREAEIRCETLGLKPKTEKMGDCVLRLSR